MVTLNSSFDRITRPASSATYATFRVIADSTSRLVAVPVPANARISIRRLSFTFSWDLSISPNNIRCWLIEGDPVPPLTLVDNTGTLDFTSYWEILSRTINTSVVSLGGISYGTSTFNPPLEAISPSGLIYLPLMTTTGSTAPAGGQVKVSLYYEYQPL